MDSHSGRQNRVAKGDTHKPVETQDKRKRALQSCDRCKTRKRACKRYNDLGEQIFDTSTPCRKCVQSQSTCETTGIRKKRTFFSVSESSLIQLKCLSRIFKAVFPECDPNDVKDRENIAKLLCVKIPENRTGAGEDGESDAENAELSNDVVDGTPEIESGTENSNSKTGVKSSEEKVKEEDEELVKLKYHEMGLGSSEKLFLALLDVQKRYPQGSSSNSIGGIHNVGENTALSNNFRTRFHKSLILNLIPRHECEFYTDYFFKHINTNFYMLIETNYRASQKLFLSYIFDNLGPANFTTEEVCVFYLVWVLGRKSFLENEKSDGISFVSNTVINNYLNTIDLCLYNTFFSNDVSTVKMLYLAGVHHSTLQNRGQSWHLMTSACLKCITLGYNRKCVVEVLPEPEQEEIKMVWWACFRYHMNGCIILGRLPNISLYEVDVDQPKLYHCKNELFKKTYLKGVELFKLMFPILKNREYLFISKDPWRDENVDNIISIKNSLNDWKLSLSKELQDYSNDYEERHLIKVHLLYHHCLMSLLVPYLIAYALKPDEKNAKSARVVDALASCIHSAVEMVNVVKVSSSSKEFTSLLWYDLFYAYNSLMFLLLAFKLIRHGSTDPNTKDFNILKSTLLKEYKIDVYVLFNSLNDIKEVNDKRGAESKTVMKDASNNITLLLKHFQINEIKKSLDKETNRDSKSYTKRTNPHIQPLYANGLQQPYQSTFLPQSDLRELTSNLYAPPQPPQPPQPLPPPSMEVKASSIYANQTALEPTYNNQNMQQSYALNTPSTTGILKQEYDTKTNIPLPTDTYGNSPFNPLLRQVEMIDADFFDILDNMNTSNETQPISLGINDKIFWDWNKLFNEDS